MVGEGSSLNREPFCSGTCSRTSPQQTRLCSSSFWAHGPGSRACARNGRITIGTRARQTFLEVYMRVAEFDTAKCSIPESLACILIACDLLNWSWLSVPYGAAPSRRVQRPTSTVLRATNTTPTETICKAGEMVRQAGEPQEGGGLQTANHHKPPQTTTKTHKPPQTANRHKPPQTTTNHNMDGKNTNS